MSDPITTARALRTAVVLLRAGSSRGVEPDVASKVQFALDRLGAAHQAHQDALEALQGVLNQPGASVTRRAIVGAVSHLDNAVQAFATAVANIAYYVQAGATDADDVPGTDFFANFKTGSPGTSAQAPQVPAPVLPGAQQPDPSPDRMLGFRQDLAHSGRPR